MKRFDHRARYPARSHNDTIDALQLCNRVKTGFIEVGDALSIYAALTHVSNFKYADLSPCPTYGPGPEWFPKRGSLPVRGLNGGAVLNIHSRANQLRWFGRGSTPFTSWGYGWDGANTVATTDGDLRLTGSGYALAGVSIYGGAWYLDDVFSGYNHPTSPTPPANVGVGDPTAPDWQTWQIGKSPFDLYDGGGALIYAGWGVSPYAPHNAAWNYIQYVGDGRYENYPVTMASPPIGSGNIVGGDFSLPLPGVDPATHVCTINDRAVVAAVVQPLDFPHLLRSLPAGTTITSAKIEVRFAGLHRESLSLSQSYNRATSSFDCANTYTTSDSAEGMTLLGRRVVDGLARWEAVAQGITGLVVSDKWQIADVTALCQVFIDTLRAGDYDTFGLIPSPYAGFTTTTDMRGVLSGLMGSVTWAVSLDPSYSRPAYASEDIYIPTVGAPQDIVYQSAGSASWVSWDTAAFGAVIIEWAYPSGEAGGVLTYGNTVRADSPELG